MIAAVDDDAFVAVDGVVVLVADSVNAGNHGSAAFAVHEVDGLPDTAVPGIVADDERTGELLAGADLIGSRLLQLAEKSNT